MPSKPLKAIKPMFQNGKWKIIRGDLVEIIAGKDKGKQGRVLRVLRDERFPRVVVENRNLVSSVVLGARGARWRLGWPNTARRRPPPPLCAPLFLARSRPLHSSTATTQQPKHNKQNKPRSSATCRSRRTRQALL